MIPMFILGIVCAIREATLTNPNFIDSEDINQGAFGAASAFAFISALVYGVKNNKRIFIHVKLNKFKHLKLLLID